jgi:ABC-type dipeptide/oligopeptide/nickel transport system permease component
MNSIRIYIIPAALRLVRFALTLFLISIIVFFILRVIPGDPAQVIAGTGARAADVERLRQQLGMDRPLIEQFTHWLTDTLSLRWGNSLMSGESALSLILSRFPLTLALAGLSFFICVTVGSLIGFTQALHEATWVDSGLSLISSVFMAIPSFWLGILLLLAFAVAIPIFPLFGAEGIKGLILPSLALGLANTALLARQTRNSLRAELSKEYVLAAEARGLSRRQAAFRHAFRNALLPVLNLAGIQFASMVGGAVIIEQVFSLPGCGRLLLTAVLQRDFPVAQACILLFATVFCLTNLAVDLIQAWVNPKLRQGGEHA